MIKAFIPHIDQIPYGLYPEGRSNPTDHSNALFSIKPLSIKKAGSYSRLPVAGLPRYENEGYAVYRAKKRPVLIISTGGQEIENHLTAGKPKWQTAPTYLVAPYYGIAQGTQRTGFRDEFIDRVRRCMFPQFMWDKLPIPGEATESLLRLDHIQPVGRHHESLELTPYRLSDEAMDIVDEWLPWLIDGCLPEDGIINLFRQGLIETL